MATGDEPQNPRMRLLDAAEEAAAYIREILVQVRERDDRIAFLQTQLREATRAKAR